MSTELKSNGVKFPSGQTQTGADIGHGSQDYSYVSRSLNTAYQNTTNQPLAVGTTGDRNSFGGGDMDVSSDGSTWIVVNRPGSDNGWGGGANTVVPPGHYYRITSGYGIRTWAELR